jgi:hypothetical protein
MEDIINAYKILVREPEGNRPFRRSRRRWEYIKMDRKEMGCDAGGLHI